MYELTYSIDCLKKSLNFILSRYLKKNLCGKKKIAFKLNKNLYYINLRPVYTLSLYKKKICLIINKKHIIYTTC